MRASCKINATNESDAKKLPEGKHQIEITVDEHGDIISSSIGLTVVSTIIAVL